MDPDIAAHRAYNLYAKGHCMYGVFASVVLQLAKEHCEPYISFPVNMTRYGGGGTAGWGSLCGALNGSAALIGLFTKKDEDLKLLVDEIFLWYEQSELPVYTPKKPTYDTEIPKSVSFFSPLSCFRNKVVQGFRSQSFHQEVNRTVQTAYG